MKQVRDGKTVSLSNETITCGGGKFYTGFTEMPERVPGFVSLKEKYKKTPEMVVDFVNELQIPKADKAYLHFARIDKIPSFDEVEGVLFLPTPDILSGLVTWTFFDNNALDAVAAHSVPAVAPSLPKPSLKTGNKGNALSWDSSTPPSAPYFEADLLSFTIPMSRFKEMYHTMRESCLFDTHAWGKIKERIQLSQSGDVHILSSPISFPILPDIYLQEIRIEDAAAIYHAIDTHRDYLRTWLPFVDNMRTTADEEAFLRQVLSAPAERNEPIFGIWNQQHEICGLIGFHFSDFDNHRTELGYWLLPEYQHRGIITESVRKLCLWAVQEKEIKRIQIRCAVGNAASNAVPVRLGFVHEGTERCGELLASGEYTDIHIYSILKEEVLANLKR